MHFAPRLLYPPCASDGQGDTIAYHRLIHAYPLPGFRATARVKNAVTAAQSSRHNPGRKWRVWARAGEMDHLAEKIDA
jgi:hypothetical protein